MSSCARRTTMVVASIFLIILANHLASVTAQISCDNSNGNYTRNSPYAANLNTVLSSLSRKVNDTGSYYASSGQNGDRANALALCRGDLQLQTCRSCIQNASADARGYCPNQMNAINWNGGSCTVRYSNQSILGTLSDSGGFNVWVLQNVSSPREFQADLMPLLATMRAQAANGGSLRKVGWGNTSGPDFLTIFALVQCTPDLSAEDCTSCLVTATRGLPPCCSPMARVYRPSCNLYYDIAPFYNETRLLELANPPPPPPVPAMPAPSPSPLLGTPPLALRPVIPPGAVSLTSPPPPGRDNKSTSRTIIIIAISVVVCLTLAVLVGILLRKRMKQSRNQQPQSEAGDDISTIESLQYDFNKIKAATNDFADANKLGQGGFGAVYRGKLPSGQEIAAKRLSWGSTQGDVEFKNEVLLLARLQHRNLVGLLGFSLEGIEKLLVYEFVQNASLDQSIFDSTRRSNLNWDMRYKIIVGIARGLLYLHEDSRLRIIHRDLKASNVLLDADMNPKIADFGTARLFDRDETRGSTSRIVGTYGYMAPEYAMHGHFSIKSDVFSFGVLVLEIVSGQKNNFFQNGEITKDLLSSAWENWREGTAANLIDPSLRATSGIPPDILRSIHIGLLCVQENASDRPTMSSVVLMLNSFSITLPVPSPPAIFVPRDFDLDVASIQQSYSRDMESSKSANSAQSICSSKNDASISDLYPPHYNV